MNERVATLVIMCFDVTKVRDTAQKFGWTEIQFNPNSHVIAFERRGREHINVYFSTQTVGTGANYPRLGKTQLFRRNVTEQELSDIFQNVRSHPGKGCCYRKVALTAPEPKLSSKSVNWLTCDNNTCLKDLIEKKSTYTPREYPVMVLGSTWLGVDCEGYPAWGPGLLKQLDNKLRGRQKWLPTVDVVCLGADDHSYFVQFANGATHWNGIPDCLRRELYQRTLYVETMALGPNDSYFCMWEDGTYCWQSLSLELHVRLIECQHILLGVTTVSLGAQGEYFILFEDGIWQANGLADSCIRALEKLQRENRQVYDIQFANDGSWLIRYNECS